MTYPKVFAFLETALKEATWWPALAASRTFFRRLPATRYRVQTVAGNDQGEDSETPRARRRETEIELYE